MKRLISILAIATAPLTIIACHRSSAAQPAATAQPTSAAPTDSPIHTISLPHYQPDLPSAPGRDVYAAACLSCHSQRYIVMQPPMPAPKWEATVRKMMTTYNAPVAEDQVAPIVQYILAARDAAPGQTWDSLAVETSTDLPTVDLSHADANHGASVYARSCAACHGTAGLGDGAGAKLMLPHPTNLTQSRWSGALVYAAIAHGVRGAAMPAATELSPADITDAAAYTLQFSRETPALAPTTQTSNAAALFAANCASCHGVTGAGDGPAAAPAARRPANFHLKQPNADYAYTVITTGIPGTTMPAWKTKLDDSQRRALANYVRAFYEK